VVLVGVGCEGVTEEPVGGGDGVGMITPVGEGEGGSIDLTVTINAFRVPGK